MTDRNETSEQSNQQSNHGFILASPTSRNSQSEALKLTKYNKLMKLYEDIKAKKRKIEDKANQLKEKKKICQGLQSVQKSSGIESSEREKEINNLKQKYEEKQRQTLQETSRGENQEKQLLKQITDLDHQIMETKKKQAQDFSGQKDQINAQIIKQQSALKNLKNENEKIKNFIADIQSSAKNLHNQSEDLTSGLALILDSVNELLLRKANIEKEQDELRHQTKIIKLRIDNEKNKLCKCEDKGCEDAGRIKELKANIQNESTKNNNLLKQVQELKKGIENEENERKKFIRGVESLQKLQKEKPDRLKKLEKEERDLNSNVHRLKEETKDRYIEVPPEYRQYKAANQKMRAQVEKVVKQFHDDKDKDAKSCALVPSNIIQAYQSQIEDVKQRYEQNRSLPDRIKRAQREIKELQEQKDQLEWNVPPIAKTLDDAFRAEERKAEEFEQQIHKLQRESAQVASKLEEYSKAYPDFEFEKKKKKAQVSPVKKEEAKMEEQNKKRKGKKAEKAMQVGEEKVEQKVEQAAVRNPVQTKRSNPPQKKKNKKKR